MSQTLNIEILVPEKTILSCEAVLVNIPETTGRIGIEARHAPLAASLVAGLVEIVLPNGKRENYEIGPGVFSFDANLARILTSEAKPRRDE
ncbi:MAG: hypothetical protein GXP32_08440 [Kiritimatiellaeota bacterium]|nr:hypothetical protein [Kiritimatiellota bacterium]